MNWQQIKERGLALSQCWQRLNPKEQLRYGVVAGGILLAALFGFWLILQLHSLNTMLIKGDTRLYQVEKGSNSARIVADLGEAQPNGLAVRVWLRLHPELVNIKSGTYEIKVGATLRDTLALFASGKEFLLQLTLIEGSRFDDFKQQLIAAPWLERLLSESTEAEIAAELGIENGKLEGWLLPETYLYSPKSSDLAILRRAYAEMRTVLDEAWAKRQPDLPYKNSYEALIMASIIEKETAKVDERPLIASVFVNRLRLGMRLQTDPTVIYGIKDRYDGNIRRRDLEDNNPYNTYVIDGLPPTPIAMPSRAAIEAALNPTKSDYLYFVATGEDGAHYFSKGLAEHNRAVRQYQLKR